MEGHREMRYNKYKKMSMNKLRQEIAKEIEIFNTNINNYTKRTRTESGRMKKENEYQQFARKRDELQSFVGTAKGSKFGLGKGYTKMVDEETGEKWSIMTNRSKAIEFLENIHMTNAWNVYTEEGKEKWEGARTKAHETFQDLYGEISREDYDKLVDMFNNIGSGKLKQYGSDQVKEDYDKYSKEYGISRDTFATVVKDVIDDSKGKGKQQYQLSDEVALRIKAMFNQVNK